MTVVELIQQLTKYAEIDPTMPVMILERGGSPREINVLPHRRVITAADAEAVYDCEELAGEKVLVMGYGSY